MQSKEFNTYHAFEYLLFYSSKYRIEGLYVCYLYLIKKLLNFMHCYILILSLIKKLKFSK